MCSSDLFLSGMMVVPGGFNSYLGCFLTQFFFFPVVGVAVWVIVMIILLGAIKKAFLIPNQWAILMGIPIILLLSEQMQQGYWIYYLKLKGFFYAPTCGILIATWALWIFRKQKSQKIEMIWMLVCTLFGYILFGAYALVGTLWMGLWKWTKADSIGNKIVTSLFAILVVGAIPLIAYHFYHHTGMDYIYTAGLPSYRAGATNYLTYHIPFIIVALFPIIPFMIKKCKWMNLDTLPRFIIVHIILLIAMGSTLFHFWYSDSNFRKELKMAYAVENEEWEKALTYIKDKNMIPTRLMILYKNLALLRLGRAGGEMYHYPDGGKLPNSPFATRMMQVGGKELYYNYGKQNFCYRWCMEDAVEFGWKVYFLKYITKSSILNGDYVLAQKYIDQLKQTLFYRTWAEKYERYVQNPALIEQSDEFKPILQLMTYDDQLDGDNSLVEMYLLNSFAHGNGDDPLYQEATRIAALNMKDIKLFWPRFNKYAQMHKG